MTPRAATLAPMTSASPEHTSPPPDAEGTHVRGRFRPHPRGFGFLTPVGQDHLTPTTVSLADAAEATGEVDRVFVPPAQARALLADDLVDATVVSGEKGPAAESVTVASRARRLVVGMVQRRRGQLVVQPEGALGTGWLTPAEGVASALEPCIDQQAVVLVGGGPDGTPVAQALVAGPHPLGSPEAIRARTVVIVLGGVAPSLVPGGAEAVGLDPATAETTHLRLMGQLAGGRRGAAGGLDRRGPVPGADLEPVERRDEACLTVDSASTRDLDDAVGASWDGQTDSVVRVAVHITDVAGDVGLGTAAEQYARTVTATSYLASGPSAPMLDPDLSEGTGSLVVGQDRPVLSVRFSVLPDGTVDDVDVEPAWVRSRARLTYGAVEQWLGGDAAQLRIQSGTQADTAEAVVRDALEAARRLGVERDARMTLEELFDEAELAPTVVNGRITLAAAEPHARAYRLIERLMVAANESVGGWLAERGVPALYRSHEGIDPQRRARLRAAAELAGASVPSLDAEHGDPDRVSGELLAEVDRLGASGRDADRELLISAATSSTARASYDPELSHHRGLAAAAYCHFTSPLRRYADLVVHRQLRATLAGEPLPHDVEELRGLSAWLATRGGALSRVEARERADLWARLLEQGDVTGTETATVTGLTPAGLRIRLPRLGLSGFLLAEAALGLSGQDRATLDVDEHGLTTTSGPWRLGSRLRVRFSGLDDTGRPTWELLGPAD